VALLGEVQKPGRYEVSRTINLLDLVALAGGFTATADPSDVTITRTVMSEGKLERREITLDLDDPTRLHEEAVALQQGDFIFIGRSSAVTVDRIMQYVTTAVVLLTAYVTISQK
jgi:protein involved in polysaccharide export with SLBB domain